MVLNLYCLLDEQGAMVQAVQVVQLNELELFTTSQSVMMGYLKEVIMELCLHLLIT